MVHLGLIWQSLESKPSSKQSVYAKPDERMLTELSNIINTMTLKENKRVLEMLLPCFYKYILIFERDIQFKNV